jgi:DNA polymerase delta subunit 1
MLETGFQIDSLHRAQSFTTYESHVLFALRFMIDCSITGGNWVELTAGAYRLLAQDDSRKQSHCQLEAHVNYRNIVSHPAEGASIPKWPLRTTSLDLGTFCGKPDSY